MKLTFAFLLFVSVIFYSQAAFNAEGNDIQDILKYLKASPKLPLSHVLGRRSVEGAQNFFIIDKIIGSILQPSLERINNILTKIHDLSKANTENAARQLRVLVNELQKVIQPHVIKIVDILQDMGIGAIESLGRIKSVLSSVITNIKVISDANKKIFLGLLDFIFRAIKGEITDPNAVTAVGADQSYLIIDRVIKLLLSPIVNKINSHLEAIKKAIEQQSNNLKETIAKHAENIAEIIRPYMIRIINLLNDAGVEAKDTLDKIKAGMNLIINNLKGISEGNIAILKTLVDYIAKVLLKGMTPDEINYGLSDIKENYIIKGIIERLVRPLAGIISSQIKSIIKSLKDQAGHLTDSIKEHLKNVAGLLKPAVNLIIKSGLSIIDANASALEQTVQALKYIFDLVGTITGISIDVTKELLVYIAKSILGVAI